MSGKNILQQIQEVTKVARQEKEGTQKFLERLIRAVDKLTDDDWNALSEPAQVWAGEAVKQLKAKDAITPPLGMGDKDGKAPPKRGSGKKAEKDADEKDGDEKDDDEKADDEKDADEKADDEKADDEKADDEKGAEKGDEKKPKKEKAEKKPKKKKADRGPGIEGSIKELLIKKPNEKPEILLEKLEKRGINTTIGTVRSIRAGFLHSWRTLHAAGNPAYPED